MRVPAWASPTKAPQSLVPHKGPPQPGPFFMPQPSPLKSRFGPKAASPPWYLAGPSASDSERVLDTLRLIRAPVGPLSVPVWHGIAFYSQRTGASRLTCTRAREATPHTLAQTLQALTWPKRGTEGARK